MSVRTYFNEHLKTLLPPSWVIYDYDKSVTSIGKVTALFLHQSVEPGALAGSLAHTINLVIIDPSTTEKSMDDRLDDLLEDIIPALTADAATEFIRADKGTYPDPNPTNPAWTIQLRITTT